MILLLEIVVSEVDFRLGGIVAGTDVCTWCHFQTSSGATGRVGGGRERQNEIAVGSRALRVGSSLSNGTGASCRQQQAMKNEIVGVISFKLVETISI